MENNLSSTKIAYIVLCHDEPQLLKRVAQTLKYKDDKLFVHVDKKIDIAPFKKVTEGIPNVEFLSTREEVFWGGFSSIIATMNLLKAVLEDTTHYTRIVLLQGKDYPLHCPSYIHSFFDCYQDKEFCKAKNISVSKDPNDYMKCCGYWDMDGKPNFLQKIIRIVFDVFNTKLKIKYRKSKFSYKKESWDVYKGWAQFAITRSFAEYVLNSYNNLGKYNKFMRHRFPPDEIYFHTLLYNSSFADNISDYTLIPRPNATWTDKNLNLTYFEYPTTVTLFKQKQELSGLYVTKALFFRKVSFSESIELLDEIDRNIEIEEENGKAYFDDMRGDGE